MGKIKVYFTNGNTGVFDRDKVVFSGKNCKYFYLGNYNRQEFSYVDALDIGPLVNWDAVSWVRAYKEEEENA